MISLKQLCYALAVEKTLHFKKAAEACNVSQSALSTAITELEKQLGTTIFERNNKQVLVTNTGQLILDKAKKVKLELDGLMQISQIDKQPFSMPMSIGVIPTIGPYLLPKVLPEVRRQYPSFKLKYKVDDYPLLKKLMLIVYHSIFNGRRPDNWLTPEDADRESQKLLDEVTQL